MDRLCMAIALLALKTINSCWTTSIKDFITSGSASAEQCYISLMLLKHFTQLFDTHVHERRAKHVAEEFIRENLKMVLDFLAQVLNQSNLPAECYLEALSAGKSWCHFSTASFVPSQQFIATVFQLMQTDSFSKVVKIIRKLLVVSKFAKSLQNTSKAEAITMAGMSEDDKRFLE